jgi:hypothetical protein
MHWNGSASQQGVIHSTGQADADGRQSCHSEIMPASAVQHVHRMRGGAQSHRVRERIDDFHTSSRNPFPNWQLAVVLTGDTVGLGMVN